MAVMFVVFVPVENDDNDSEEDKFHHAKSKHEANPSNVEAVNYKSGKLYTKKATDENNCNGITGPVKRDPNHKGLQHNSSQQSELKHDQVEISVEYPTFEWALQTVLDKHDIVTDTWATTDDGHLLQVTFIVGNEYVETILIALNNIGIGTETNTMISIYPANFIRTGSSSLTSAKENDGNEASQSEQKKSEFMKSVKARLTVAQVVDAIRKSSRLTFDYVLFIILSSIIASLAFAENSSMTIIASQLLAPLMGPIMGSTFGFVIRNKPLTKLAVSSLLIGLSVCLAIGFFMGFIMSGVNNDGAHWGNTDTWPTSEMTKRGQTHSLWVGVLIALCAGAGVALSILGGNAGPLVGVAVSASLLPPFVNAGLLWTQAIIWAAKPPPWESRPSVNDTITHGLHCGTLKNNKFVFTYSCTPAADVAILGVVSFSLTILNIICIFIMGIIILKVKEVAPHTAVSKPTEKFWKEDVKIARAAHKTMKTKNRETYIETVARELAEEAKRKGLTDELLFEETLEGLDTDETFQDINHFLPMKTTELKKVQREIRQQRMQQVQEALRGTSVYLNLDHTVESGVHRGQSVKCANNSIRQSTAHTPTANVRFQFDTPGKRHPSQKRRNVPRNSATRTSAAEYLNQLLKPGTPTVQTPRQPFQMDCPPLPPVREQDE